MVKIGIQRQVEATQMLPFAIFTPYGVNPLLPQIRSYHDINEGLLPNSILIVDVGKFGKGASLCFAPITPANHIGDV
jgi:hypothetical protein